MISQAELHRLFDYQDGNLIRKTNASGNARKGDIAAYIGKRGYYYVGIDYKRVLVHRLIYTMHFGHTDKELDHVDGNPLNNRIENLRVCTSSQNKFNMRRRHSNTSGLKGVSWNSENDSWRARIIAHGKTYEVGSFKTIFDAACQIMPARKRLHGEFANNG